MPLINVPGVALDTNAPDVIWETNFSSDASFSESDTGGFAATQPTGWTACKAVFANSTISGESGEGVGGSVAMKFKWHDDGATAPTCSLSKHLTGNKTTGYSELYIRYRIRLPDDFKVTDGIKSLGYWKWMRLWQNTGPTNDGTWTENRSDSHSIVWNFAGSPAFGHDVNLTAAASSYFADANARALGSNGGGRMQADYFASGSPHNEQPGYFERMAEWDIDYVTNVGWLLDRDQGWHTVEIRMKAATTTSAEDGIFQLWFDGVDQGNLVRYGTQGLQRYGIITNTTQANPCVVTVDGDSDDFQTGDVIQINNLNIGMTELEDRTFTITRLTSTTFSLDGEDATGHTAWSASETNAEVNCILETTGWGGLFTGIPTAVEGAGTGWNWLGVFDNISGLNEDWADVGVDGFVYLNDVVVSTTRIGHNYNPTDDGSG